MANEAVDALSAMGLPVPLGVVRSLVEGVDGILQRCLPLTSSCTFRHRMWCHKSTCSLAVERWCSYCCLSWRAHLATPAALACCLHRICHCFSAKVHPTV